MRIWCRGEKWSQVKDDALLPDIANLGPFMAVPRKREIRIGRSEKNDIVFLDDSQISNRHCVIHKGILQNSWSVEDRSTNGVFFNQEKDRMKKNNVREIKNRDILRFGRNVQLQVEF
jgi:pSer/pThr/pTyr-binding forkhead associated (FHA) protein